jgi:hypothetical protein
MRVVHQSRFVIFSSFLFESAAILGFIPSILGACPATTRTRPGTDRVRLLFRE